LTSAVTTAPWEFTPVPDAWRVGAHRNIVGGALAAVLSLPLAMGLGAIAVAPLGPAYVGAGVLAGLYGAAFLGLVALLAGARGIAIYAPRSLVSFMTAAVCAQVIVGAGWLPKDDPDTVLAALFLVLSMAGIFQLVFGLSGLSRLVKYIPMPVLAGFQNAAAIIIATAQIHIFLGLPAKPSLAQWPAALGEAHPLTLVVGVATLALIFHGQRLLKRVPPHLTALAGGIVLYYAFYAAGFGALLGPTLGRVPASLPDGRQFGSIMAVVVRPGFLEALPGMILGAASIAVVASLDVLMSAKILENLSHQRGNSTRQLLCIGAANTVAPLLGGLAGSITLGPSTASFKNGARNSLALFTHATLFLLFVPLVAPLLSYIPLVVVGALVLHAGSIVLFDRWTLQLLRRLAGGQTINWGSIAIDLVVIGLVTGIAVAGQVVAAVALGIAIAVVVFTLRMSRGVIRSMRYGDQLQSRRTRERADLALLAENGRRILAIEIEGPLFFASAEILHNCIDSAIAQQARYVILDVSRVNELDSTGARIVLQTHERCRAEGVHLVMCGHDDHAQTASLLADHRVAHAITRERMFPDLDHALEWCENELLRSLKTAEAEAGDHPFDLLDITQGLSAEEREVLRAALGRREFAKGETVFAQNDPGDALYMIVRGSASVRLQGEAGRERRLVTFSSGTVFGEMALLDREKRSATVIADEPLRCYVLERTAFDEFSVLRPRIATTILANLGRELSLRMRRVNRILAERS
jgi:anti-anti-sigma factor